MMKYSEMKARVEVYGFTVENGPLAVLANVCRRKQFSLSRDNSLKATSTSTIMPRRGQRWKREPRRQSHRSVAMHERPSSTDGYEAVRPMQKSIHLSERRLHPDTM